LADGYDVIIDLEKSHGSWIVDARDGREYFDLFSMFASMTVGYNHPFMVEHQDLLAHAALHKPTLSDIYTQEYAAFLETFSREGMPDYLPHAFFIEGGGLAVENTLKAAFDWKVRKNIAAGRGERGSRIVHFKGCFHGRTGYTMSLTDSPDPRKTLYYPQFDWPRITHPTATFPLDDNAGATEALEALAISEILAALSAAPDDIAAIIIEPIQGEGGDNHIRPAFATQLRELCDEHEMLLIYDEVQTGVGITGKFWAHELFGQEALPDLIAFGKKSQVCGMLAGPRLDEVEHNVFTESSRINSTFGGNLADMVRFDLILQIMRAENLLEQVQSSGELLLSRLHELAEEFPAFVTHPRGAGLFAAFDLPSSTERDAVISKIMENGIIILGCGTRSIRFRPHLNITVEEIDTATEIITRSIRSCLA
ncbi:MAG: L-lysine 6-transaminase, partial [Candidatus Marinimicrobia bacterium]|nr:L-lysine 6-transaminase [Candidatus Neomarinimicrobiota bacterium]